MPLLGKKVSMVVRGGQTMQLPTLMIVITYAITFTLASNPALLQSLSSVILFFKALLFRPITYSA